MTFKNNKDMNVKEITNRISAYSLEVFFMDKITHK